MKSIRVSKQHTLIMVLGFMLVFSACKKDSPLVELILDKTEAEVFSGENVMVNITSGDGSYSVSSSAEAIAKADISGQSVRIAGISKGEATITVKDRAGRTVAIQVSVKSAIVDATTPRFKWENTVELGLSNGWGITVLSDRVAITQLSEGKQLVLTWAGGYSVGDKTEAKLRTIERGKTTVEVELTALEVQKAEKNNYSIIFNKDTQKGELVFVK